jgi:23S rRNA pseudouridine1911/1915/1917 synthase
VRIVHVDARVVVIDKPGGMPGHALDPRQRGTAAAFLAGRFPETAEVGDALSSGLAHRLDTGTSGLQIAARTPDAYARLRAAFRAGDVTKRYLALVTGDPPAQAVVERPLAHDPGDRRRMVAARPGERAWPARTEVRRLAAGGACILVEATLRSGVTHQVRAHLAQLGCPVVGDVLYGGLDAGLGSSRHALHASALAAASRVPDLPDVESPLPRTCACCSIADAPPHRPPAARPGSVAAVWSDPVLGRALALPPRGSFAVLHGMQRLFTLFGSSTRPSSML